MSNLIYQITVLACSLRVTDMHIGAYWVYTVNYLRIEL